MDSTQIDIRFEGSKFIPSRLEKETGWPLKILAEAGKISQKGKFKGEPSPYGIAYHTIKQNLGMANSIQIINNYSDKLLKIKNRLEELGVEEVVFDIETQNSKQYSYSLDPEIISKLQKLNARIDFHGNEVEIAIDRWLNEFQSNSNKFLDKDQSYKFNIIKDKIVHTSPHIHVYNMSHLYDFLMLYLIKHLGKAEENIPSFESSYLEYEKSK